MMSDSLPQARERGADDVVLFLSSLRWCREGFRCAFNEVCSGSDTPRKWTCTVTSLLYPILVPQDSLRGDVAEEIDTRARGRMTVFDGDNKRYRQCALVCCLGYTAWEKQMQSFRQAGVETLMFHRQNTFDGNMTALVNKLKIGCYLLDKRVCERFPPTLPLPRLGYDAATEAALFVEMHPHIYRAPFVEAAFDIETIVNKVELCPDYITSPVFVANAEAVLATSKFATKTRLNLGHTSLSPLDHGAVASIAVVVADGPKKRRLVYYNGQLATATPEAHAGRFWVSARAQFIRCADERDVVRKFLHAIQNVNVLYVYNAEFDVKVISERVLLYKTDAPDLLELWERFLRKDAGAEFEACAHNDDPRKLREQGKIFFRPGLHFCTDAVLQHHCATLAQVKALHKKSARHAAAAFGALAKANREFRKKVQSFRADGFRTHIVDLYRLAHTQQTTAECKSRKLDTIARYFLAPLYENKLKACKVGDIHYQHMDAVFTGADGKELFRYLVYNLTDAELLMRLAKVLEPPMNFINRLRATMNIDLLHYGRARYMYDGCVQSTRAVEVPLTAIRLKKNRVVSTDLGAADNMLPPEYRYGKKIEIIGGYVAEPLLGLNFARPGQGVEITVDFASLYPSNMKDANIGVDAVVARQLAAKFPGWVVFDWGEVEEKYPLLSIMYRPDGRRFVTVASGSLTQYIEHRNHHKKLMKDAPKAVYKFHNTQQCEMKICANSHYGVSPPSCQMLTTALGRKKIKLVEALVKELGYTHNYGDTDSVMFDVPCGGLPCTDAKRPDSFVVYSERDPGAWGASAKRLSEQVCSAFVPEMERFLALAHERLNQDFVAQLKYVDRRGRLVSLDECPHADEVRAHFAKTTDTKLCLENFSTITMRLQKKMYMNLVHEARPDDPVGKVSTKMRGVIAIKSSAVGATRAIYGAFRTLVMEGGAIKRVDDFDRLKCVHWRDLAPGDVVLAGQDRFEAVLENSAVPVSPYWQVRCVRLDGGAVLVYEDVATGISLNHVLGKQYSDGRCQMFEAFCIYYAFSTAAALHSEWHELVRYVSLGQQNAYQRMARARLGLGEAKENKIPHVPLDEHDGLYKQKTIERPKGFARQDPAASFFMRYRFDTGSAIVARDTLGVGIRDCGRSAPGEGLNRAQTKHVLHNDLLIEDDTHTKLLGHVLLELCVDAQDVDRRCAAAFLKKSYAALKAMEKRGSEFHKGYFNAIPADMRIRGSKKITDFMQSVQHGGTSKTWSAPQLPESWYGRDFQGATVARAIQAQTMSDALGAGLVVPVPGPLKGCVAFAFQGQHYRTCDDTSNPRLLAAARGIYLHALFADAGEATLRKRKVQSNEALGPPPKRCTKVELKAWYFSNREQLTQKKNFHCITCKLYWQSVALDDFFSTEYACEGTTFVRKKRVVCMDEL